MMKGSHYPCQIHSQNMQLITKLVGVAGTYVSQGKCIVHAYKHMYIPVWWLFWHVCLHVFVINVVWCVHVCAC